MRQDRFMSTHRICEIFLTSLAAVAFSPALSAQADETPKPSMTSTAPVGIHLTSAPAVTRDTYSVSGKQTPSGFDVPRFVSLKFGRVNARTGPSRNHSIAYQYRRRGLPLIVVAETEMWRKVRDIHGDEAWVRKPALSGERSAVLTQDTDLRLKANSESRRLARVERGALVQLGNCEKTGYCRITTSNGMKGFAQRDALWGAHPIG